MGAFWANGRHDREDEPRINFSFAIPVRKSVGNRTSNMSSTGSFTVGRPRCICNAEVAYSNCNVGRGRIGCDAWRRLLRVLLLLLLLLLLFHYYYAFAGEPGGRSLMRLATDLRDRCEEFAHRSGHRLRS